MSELLGYGIGSCVTAYFCEKVWRFPLCLVFTDRTKSHIGSLLRTYLCTSVVSGDTSGVVFSQK